MPRLVIETKINAAPEICFNLIRQASLETGEQKIIGDFEKGQTVIFQSSFLGFKQNLTVKVTEFEKPRLFIDEMTKGIFKNFCHIHEFILQNNSETLLKDTFQWTAPLRIIGKLFNKLLEKRLRKIVTLRNEKLKQITEKKKRII